MLVKEIEISKITKFQNIRTEEGDVSDLMKSIEKNGLQHPIGVYKKDDKYILCYGFRRLQALKKLGWKTIPAVIIDDTFSEDDLLTKNAIENIHRKDITPIELGKICQRFIDKGFTKGEVAAKLHISKSRVNISYQMFQKIPKKYRNLIGFIERGQDNKGMIPVNVARAIISLRITQKEIDKLLKIARAKSLTMRHIGMIHNMLQAGISLDEAIDNLGKYTIRDVFLKVNIDEFNRLNLKGSFGEYVRGILLGEEPLNKKLFS